MTLTLTNQQVLITGATGFLGGALAKRLAGEGVPVRAVVRSPRKADRLREWGVEVVAGDITDAGAMITAARGCSVIFHLAAALGGSYATQQAVNVEGTRHVVEAAKAAGAARVVYVSSISVYGFNYAGDVTETCALAPGADPYAITKAAAEAVVRESGIDCAIVRPGMIYGAGAVNWTGNLFKLAKIKPTPFVGYGGGSAYPIYVDDVIDLLIAAAIKPEASRQAFNCTPDPSPTWREFLGQYQRLAGHDQWLAIPPVFARALGGLALIAAPRFSMMRDLPDMISFLTRRITYKTDKARELLGWQPQVALEDGVNRCAGWLRDQGLLK